jgi:hypothetical protein
MTSYLAGSAWSTTTAKKTLPILVNFAGSSRKTTYTELSLLVFRDKKYAHPLMAALGRLGKALESLSSSEHRKFGDIPPIQLLVCNKQTGRPGNLALGFVGFTKAVTSKMSKQQLNTIVLAAHQKVFEYSKWPEVLNAFGLTPVTLKIPAPGDVLPAIDTIERNHKGEGDEHKRLKRFVAQNPKEIGVRWPGGGETEVLLLSGDRLDVSFRNNEAWIAVEVKGKNSPEADLVRGIFQCVKYRVIMAAQLRYEVLSGVSRSQAISLKAMLVCGCAVPSGLHKFAESLNVEMKSGVAVPENFMPKTVH